MTAGYRSAPLETASGFGRLSVVIANYNYERFVADAVESALAVDWPDVEIIVVDDGSTDRSMEILEGFVGRITLLTQENAGPRLAYNRGFAKCTGDVVIFLDSDDMVHPSIASEIASVWRQGISKVQVQMHRVDANGKLLPAPIPRYDGAAPPAQMRRWMLMTSAYPTPPGSGNAYSRPFLEQLFPLDDSCGDAADSICLAAAPLLGDVVTLAKPLASYRVHGGNRSSLRSDPGRFSAQITRALQRHVFALRIAKLQQTESVPQAVFRSRHLLQMRVAERRVSEGDPAIPGDSMRRLLGDVVACMWAPGPEPAQHRAAVSVWCLLTLLVPEFIARRLIARRFP